MAGHQTPTKVAVSHPSSAGQGEKNTPKGLWVKDKERSFTNYCHRQNRLNLGEMNLIYYQTNQSRGVDNKTEH